MVLSPSHLIQALTGSLCAPLPDTDVPEAEEALVLAPPPLTCNPEADNRVLERRSLSLPNLISMHRSALLLLALMLVVPMWWGPSKGSNPGSSSSVPPPPKIVTEDALLSLLSPPPKLALSLSASSRQLELLSSDPDISSVAEELSLDCKAGLTGNFGARLSRPYTILLAAMLLVDADFVMVLMVTVVVLSWSEDCSE